MKTLPRSDSFVRREADAATQDVASARGWAADRPAHAYDALVLDGSRRQALAIVRSLGRRGRRVAIAGESRGHCPAAASRWCRGYVSLAASGKEFPPPLAMVEGALAAHPTDVVIAVADGTIAWMRAHRARLARHARLAIADEGALSIAVDKELTLRAAERLGIRVPRSVRVETAAEAATAVREIGLPAVLKPVESWVNHQGGGVRVASRLVTTEAEARREMSALEGLGSAALVQRLLTGRNESVSLFRSGGEIRARFAQWAKRTEPPLGGTDVLYQSIPVPEDTGRQAERLVAAIGLDGYAHVEFRRDEDGTPYLMEINPRLAASVALAVRCGVDFPWLLYQWTCGERVDVVPGYRGGVWMRYLAGDMRATSDLLLERGRPGTGSGQVTRWRVLRDFAAAFWLTTRDDYLDWRDPAPALRASADFVRSSCSPSTLRRLRDKAIHGRSRDV